MDVEPAITDLYQRRPDQFVAARDALAAELRASGHVEDAEAVKRLRKPTMPAWAVNRAAHRDEASTKALAALRTDFERAAAEGGAAAIREAGARRRELVDTLVALAMEELGKVGTEGDAHRAAIVATLEAATIDDGVAGALLAGRLERPASAAGLGWGHELADVVRIAPVDRERRDRRKIAKERRAEAEAAARELRAVEREAEELTDRMREAQAGVERLRERARAAEASAEEAERAARDEGG